MKNQNVQFEETENVSVLPKNSLATDPKDRPKPDGGEVNEGEGEDEDEKPGENIFN